MIRIHILNCFRFKHLHSSLVLEHAGINLYENVLLGLDQYQDFSLVDTSDSTGDMLLASPELSI